MLDLSGKIEEFQGDYRWLSNFWPCNIPLGSTVEHVYQASKFAELEIRVLILRAETPAKAKKLSQQYSISMTDFHKKKVVIMSRLLKIKFCPKMNPELHQLLMDTKGLYIQEGNRWGDAFWGVDLRTGVGQNVLGNLIMNIRDGE